LSLTRPTKPLENLAAILQAALNEVSVYSADATEERDADTA
jgi:hypothetical protein